MTRKLLLLVAIVIALVTVVTVTPVRADKVTIINPAPIVTTVSPPVFITTGDRDWDTALSLFSAFNGVRSTVTLPSYDPYVYHEHYLGGGLVQREIHPIF